MGTAGPRKSRDDSEVSNLEPSSLPAPARRDGLDALWPSVFRELKRLAHRRLAAERTGHTLSTTALVHEVYLRLLDQHSISWENRAEFFGQAARAMRRILVDYARRHRALRRGGDASPRSLDILDATTSGARPGFDLPVVDQAEQLLDLNDAITALARVSPRAAEVVECRFFGGLTEKETALVLGVTERTVARDWIKARIFLREALK
jgi:RNA polymerase sigma factor (TIGR02999 family)